MDFVHHRNHRLEMRIRVLNHHRLDSIHPDRQVVGRISIWLDKGDMNIEIRSHIVRYPYFVRRVCAGCLDPFAGHYLTSVLYGN